jgi:hypothetical protein
MERKEVWQETLVQVLEMMKHATVSNVEFLSFLKKRAWSKGSLLSYLLPRSLAPGSCSSLCVCGSVTMKSVGRVFGRKVWCLKVLCFKKSDIQHAPWSYPCATK